MDALSHGYHAKNDAAVYASSPDDDNLLSSPPQHNNMHPLLFPAQINDKDLNAA